MLSQTSGKIKVVICNHQTDCSLKDSDYIGIFSFFNFSTIPIIILFPDRRSRSGISETAVSHQTSHTYGPLPLAVHLIFFETIQNIILDLEPNLGFQIFLNIFETNDQIFSFYISKRSSDQELPLIFLS